MAQLSAFALLGLGLLLGLKHATEADHIVAVSTIVSRERNVLRSAFVGALWGVGHTASLIVVGVIVLQSARPSPVSGSVNTALSIIKFGGRSLLLIVQTPWPILTWIQRGCSC